jgi:transposase
MSKERLARLVLLPELELVKSVKLGNRILGLLCKKNSTHEVCPKCSCPSESVYDHRPVRIKEEPLRNKLVVLLISKRRFYCSHCKKPFTEPISGIGKGRRTTERLRSAICWAAENFHDLSRVQRHYDCSAHTVYRATYELLLRNAEDLESHERRIVIHWLNFHPELHEIYE